MSKIIHPLHIRREGTRTNYNIPCFIPFANLIGCSSLTIGNSSNHKEDKTRPGPSLTSNISPVISCPGTNVIHNSY